MNGFIQKNHKALIKGGVLVIFLAVMLVIPHYTGIWNNPVTVPLLILFWLGIAYLILPEFFKKYRIAILSVYGLVFAYHFFFFNTAPDQVENYRLNLINFMLLPIPVFVALWGYEQWRWLKMLKADKARAELALLTSQINPHFFFNTLNNLYGLVVEKSEKAPEVVLKLSDMMRYTIYQGKEDFVLLKDEINYLENYIELHKIRYQKEVEIRFDYDVREGLKVAPLLFIILLENALKHGVEPLTEDAYIHLDLKTLDNQILFTIANNYEPNAPQENAGIGLDNLKKRLAHIYPNRHELKIEKTEGIYRARLNLVPNP
ncbi:sensor histidine kinase [Ulvibacterium sp.]|uniref:sensor histidine kinase n=1 Tax=Ulvibacterium sp. TaxID=2665914 RepID=UPI003BA9E037